MKTSATRVLLALGVLLAVAACAAPGNHAVQFAQEQHACAELGLAPGTTAFTSCVSNLDATMFELDNTAAR